MRSGDLIELIGKSGRVWGAAIKSTSKKYQDPMIISQGHKISLKTAIKVVKECLDKGHRVPEPIHLADQRSREIAKTKFYESRQTYGAAEDKDSDDELKFERVEESDDEENVPKVVTNSDGWETVSR